jgi:hypothetical protein
MYNFRFWGTAIMDAERINLIDHHLEDLALRNTELRRYL